MQVYGTREGSEKVGSGVGRRLALESPVGGRLRGEMLPLLLEAELVGYLGTPVSCVFPDTVSRTQTPSGAPRRSRDTRCPSTTSLVAASPTEHLAPD